MGQKRRNDYPYRLTMGGYNPKSHQDLNEQMARIKAWMKVRYRGRHYSGQLVRLYVAYKRAKAMRDIDPSSALGSFRGWQKMYVTRPPVTPVEPDKATSLKRKHRILYKLSDMTFKAIAFKALVQLVSEGKCKTPKKIQ